MLMKLNSSCTPQARKRGSEYIFDRVLMINNGQVVIDAHVDEIKDKGKTVEEVFKEVFSYAW